MMHRSIYLMLLMTLTLMTLQAQNPTPLAGDFDRVLNNPTTPLFYQTVSGGAVFTTEQDAQTQLVWHFDGTQITPLAELRDFFGEILEHEGKIYYRGLHPVTGLPIYLVTDLRTKATEPAPIPEEYFDGRILGIGGDAFMMLNRSTNTLINAKGAFEVDIPLSVTDERVVFLDGYFYMFGGNSIYRVDASDGRWELVRSLAGSGDLFTFKGKLLYWKPGGFVSSYSLETDTLEMVGELDRGRYLFIHNDLLYVPGPENLVSYNGVTARVVVNGDLGSQPVPLGDSIYYQSSTDFEIWKTGQAPVENAPLSDIVGDGQNIAVSILAPLDDALFFALNGRAYLSDGTPGGTAPLPDLDQLDYYIPNDSTRLHASVDGVVLFSAISQGLGGVWSFDGTTLTARLLDAPPRDQGRYGLEYGDNQLRIALNAAVIQNGGLWRLDPSGDLIQDLASDQAKHFFYNNGTSYFFANDHDNLDLHIWDGVDTTIEFTVQVDPMQMFGEQLGIFDPGYVDILDPQTGEDLAWLSVINNGPPGATPSAVFLDDVYYAAFYSGGLMATRLNESQVELMDDVRPYADLVTVAGEIYALGDFGLYRTLFEERRVTGILTTGGICREAGDLLVFRNKIYLIHLGTLMAYDPILGIAQPIAPLSQEACFSYQFHEVNDHFFLVQFQNGNDFELWRSNGVADGTFQLGLYGPIQEVARAGDQAVFVSHTLETGVELFQTNGTVEGTHIFSDQIPGLVSSWPEELTFIGSQLFYSAVSPGLGREVFRACFAPDAAIQRAGTLCVGTTGLTASVADAGPGAVYSWSIDGGLITAGADSRSITFDHTAGDVTLSVQVTTPGNCGAESTRVITALGNEPLLPAGITGPTTFCPGQVVNYSVPAMPGVDTYTWSLPSDASILDGQGSEAITVQFGRTQGQVSVVARNDCGISQSRDLTVQRAAGWSLADAGPDQSICGQSTTLEADIEAGAAGRWSITSGFGGSFSSLTNPNATFTGEPNERYRLLWTVDNGTCAPETDEVAIGFYEQPLPAEAGINITSCTGELTTAAFDDGLGVGRWELLNISNHASPQDWTLEDPNSAATRLSVDSVMGVEFMFRWVMENGNCPNESDIVSYWVARPPDTFALEASETEITVNGSVHLSAPTYPGIDTNWSIGSGAPSQSQTQFDVTTGGNVVFTPQGGTGNYRIFALAQFQGCTLAESIINIRVVQTAGLPPLLRLEEDAAVSGSFEMTPFRDQMVFAQNNQIWLTRGTASSSSFLFETETPLTPRAASLESIYLEDGAGQLWISDGSISPPAPLRGLPGPVDQMLALGGTMLMTCDGALYAHGAGDRVLRLPSDRDVRALQSYGSQVVFLTDAPSGQTSIWLSNGTVRGTYPQLETNRMLEHLVVAGAHFVYVDHAQRLYSANASGSNELLLHDYAASVHQLITLGNRVFVAADDTRVYDAATGGLLTVYPNASAMAQPVDASLDGKRVWLTAQREMVMSDGTLEGTTRLDHLSIPNTSTMASHGGNLYFTAYGAGVGQELWRSDGSLDGTHPAVNFAQEGSGDPLIMGQSSNRLFIATRGGDTNAFIFDTPATTRPIDAPPSICAGQTFQIRLEGAPEGSSYQWVVGNGTLVAGQGTAAPRIQAGAHGRVTLFLQEGGDHIGHLLSETVLINSVTFHNWRGLPHQGQDQNDDGLLDILDLLAIRNLCGTEPREP